MAPSPARIGVVGFGVAGATIAPLLAEQGHDVTILERAPRLGPVGAGLLLQPSGQLVLERLALMDGIARQSEPIGRVVARTHRGRVLVDLVYGELGPGLQAYGVHRAVLFEALRTRVEASAVRVVLDAEIVSRIGNALLDANGRRHGPFDAVVVADGSASGLRSSLGLERHCHDYAWGAVWAVGQSMAVRRELRQTVRGTRQLVGLLPLGGGRCNVFWSQRVAAYDDVRRRGLRRWRDEVLALCPEAEETLDRVSGFDDLTLTTYRHAFPRRAHDGWAVLVGDAWHAMSPHLGQGVNLALVDAWTLARSIEESAVFPEAFERLAERRRAQLRYYAFVTAALTPFFQSGGVVRGLARDVGLPLLARVGPARRRMTLTMTGLATGFVRGRFSL